MALAATTIWETRTGGSDTLNGGAFDPGQTGGMFTDGAATVANTSAPVFSSASYNFVAGDVGAWIFVASGTNWIPGWYKINSVASNVATLIGTIGLAVKGNGASISQLIPSTVVGCASTASPTGAIWSIDYSQQTAAEVAYTDLASVGAGLLVSSVANPFGAQQVGNSIVITGGTNFTVGIYVIASVAAGVATVVGAANITTAAGVSGTGGLGGSHATPGRMFQLMISGNRSFLQTGTYSITSTSNNIANGRFTAPATSFLQGYDTIRGDILVSPMSGTRPTIVASGVATITLITGAASVTLANLIIDGASLTAIGGVSNSGILYNCLIKNLTGANGAKGTTAIGCEATNCTIEALSMNTYSIGCVSHGNSVTGFVGSGALLFCISYGHTGGSSHGFSSYSSATNCIAYGNGGSGFIASAASNTNFNCIAEGNTGVGFDGSSGSNVKFINCVTYNNTGGIFGVFGTHYIEIGSKLGTGSFFINAAGADFTLNNTAGAGAILRAAGFPGILPVGGTGYLDIGTLQHQDSGSGGGGVRLAGVGGLASAG